jgi:hypothetical protein
MFELFHQKSLMLRTAVTGGALACASSGFASWIYFNSFFPNFTCPIDGIVNRNSALTPDNWFVIFAVSLVVAAYTMLICGRFLLTNGYKMRVDETGISVNSLWSSHAYYWGQISECETKDGVLSFKATTRSKLFGNQTKSYSFALSQEEQAYQIPFPTFAQNSKVSNAVA